MTIIKDVSETLKEILQQIPELTDEDSITFDSPADVEETNKPILSIFLYQVVENSFLRNLEPEPIGIDQMQYPPLVIDLHYVFTPFSRSKDKELMIIEQIMQIFYDNSVFTDEMINDNLRNSGNDAIKIVPDNLSFDDLSKLWERFPEKDFKLSISYVLTPVRIPSGKPIITITRVLEKDIDMYRLEQQNGLKTKNIS